MDKLLLMLTLVAFSSGVLCNEAQNLTEASLTAVETQVNNVVCKLKNTCTNGAVRDDYAIIPKMGAYKLHLNPMATWNKARKICEQEGAQLAVINSVEEAKILSAWMVREHVTDFAWIGTHDLFEAGNWVTLTGETLAAAGYDQWGAGEPNNEGGNEHCGTLVTTNGMNDERCGRMLPYYCKLDIY